MEPTLNPKQEIISLMRGFYALPVLSSLEKHGVLSELRETGKYMLSAKNAGIHGPTLVSMLQYLCRLNLLEKSEESYLATELGQKVIKRSGSFLIMHSYHEYIENLDQLLEFGGDAGQKVDRTENVIGSGLIHHKKYFSRVSDILDLKSVDKVIDIACGSGEFLAYLKSINPQLKIAGVDLNIEAINESRKTLGANVELVLSDGLNFDKWKENIHIDKDESIVVSMWFFLHEVFSVSVEKIADFFVKIKKEYPKAQFLIGEIVQLSTKDLAKSHSESITPEFLFFHELSHQCVPSWSEYQKLLSLIPFQLVQEIRFDEINGIPSSFIWLLK
jgi:SAM-dependent methyltransferase